MGQFESLLWEHRTRRSVHYRHTKARACWDGSPLMEWTSRPLGRLGRPLITEIESYLEFYAIARAHPERARVP